MSMEENSYRRLINKIATKRYKKNKKELVKRIEKEEKSRKIVVKRQSR